jgi:NitT/TauT family transport system substrate-binding protein
MGRWIISIVAVAMFLIGCEKSSPDATSGGPSTNTSGSAGASPKVKLQLNWKAEPQFGGFFAAEAGGNYTKHDLQVEITQGGVGTPTVDMLGAGTVPFAVVSGDQIIMARANGNNIVALFAVYQTNPQGIMTRAARGFKSIEDIFTHEGTLAMEKGLPYSKFLEKKFGFSKLKVVPSPGGDLSLYRTDPNYAMQCFVTSEPIAAKATGIEPQTFLIAESGYNPYTTVLATTDAYLKENPQVVKAMVQAVREGWQEYLSNPAKTNEMMQKLNPTMDAATFAASAEAQKPLILAEDPSGTDVGAMSLERWKTLTDQLLELNAIAKAVPPEACFVDPKQLQ